MELASERFCEILGITRDVFEHTPGIIEEMVHPEDKAEFARKNVEANTLLVPFQWEGRMRVGARTIWAHFESLPRLIADGDVLWTGFLHDVTGRKVAEEALVRSEASLRKEQNFNHLLLNNTSALIVAMDLDGMTLMMNKALLNLLEYTRGRGPRGRLPGDVRAGGGPGHGRRCLPQDRRGTRDHDQREPRSSASRAGYSWSNGTAGSPRRRRALPVFLSASASTSPGAGRRSTSCTKASSGSRC